MRKKGWGILALLSLCLFAACDSKKSESSNKDESKKTVTIAIADDYKSKGLDATSYDSAMALYGAVYEPLVEYAGKGTYKAGLAESWEKSEDGKSYTFHLKKDKKFSDGSDVTADAVKFTLERAKFMNKSSTHQTIANLETIEIVDDHTVKLVFNQVANQVLAELCQARPLRIMSPNSVDTKKYDGTFKQAIGSGAFRVDKVTEEQTTMVPNPYFNKEQPVDYQVVFKMIQDGSSRFLAMKSGEVDIVGGTLGELSESDRDTLAKDKAYHAYDFKGTKSYFMGFNPENKQLTEGIRKGIAMAIDTSTLSDKKITGLFRDTVQYVNDKNQPGQTFDPTKSKALFEKEGYQLNNDGYYEKDQKPLAFNLVIQTTEFPEWKEKAENIQQQLKQVGVNVSIQLVDRESYYDILWKTRKYDLIFYRTYTDALMPYNFSKELFANKEDQVGILANDTVLTDLLATYAKTNDEAQQQEVFTSIFKRIDDQAWAVPFDYKDEQFITSKKITEFKYGGLTDAPIDFAHLVVK